MSSDSYAHESEHGAQANAGRPQKFNNCVKTVTIGPVSEPVDTPGQPSLPVVGDGLVEAKQRRRQTGRRGKKPQGVERPPDGSAMTVAETPAELRDLILLTREQAATLAGVGLNKIDEWCREPGFPVIREGGHFVRIVREPFQQWLVELAERLNPPEQPAYRPRPRNPKRQ